MSWGICCVTKYVDEGVCSYEQSFGFLLKIEIDWLISPARNTWSPKTLTTTLKYTKN